MTEEELSALIDESVNEAIKASEASSQATTQATSDGSISDEDIAEMMVYVDWANEAIAYSEYLMNEYYSLYGEYAEEAIAVMQAMEEDLNSISASLDEIDQILVQGSDAATAAVEQLNSAAQTAQANLGTVQGNVEGWATSVQSGIQIRTDQALNIAPNQVADNLDGTVTIIHDYIDSVKAGLEDHKISPSELSNIAQLSANAQASIQAFGTPRLKDKSSQITALTTQLAQGQFGAAQITLPQLELDLPSRPGR